MFFFYPFFLRFNLRPYIGNHLIEQALAFLSRFGIDGMYLALAICVGGGVSALEEMVVQLVDAASSRLADFALVRLKGLCFLCRLMLLNVIFTLFKRFVLGKPPLDFVRRVDLHLISIEKDLSAETEPEIVVKNTRNARMTVSPFSIYLSGECDADNPESPNENGLDKCFLLPEWDDTSKVTLTDGTVYYLYTNEGGEHREGENGVYHTTVHLKYSTVIGPPLEPENIFVNIKDIESVTINGDTIYRN